jgi:hypothetical protein
MLEKIFLNLLIMVVAGFTLVGCGGGSGNDTQNTSSQQLTGVFQSVEGAYYTTTSNISGYTTKDGSFQYNPGDDVTFSTDDIILGTVKAGKNIDVTSFKKPGLVTQTLHALDQDGDIDNGIQLSHTSTEQSKEKALTAAIARSPESSKISLEKINAYDVNYINYLKQNGLNVEDQNIALAAELMKRLKINPYKGEKNYVSKIMAGQQALPPFSRYAKDGNISKFVKSRIKSDEAFDERVKVVTLYQMMLQTIKAQQNDSTKVVSDSKAFKKQGEQLITDTMYTIDQTIDAIDNMDKTTKELAKTLAINAAGYGIDTLVPDNAKPEAKMLLTMATTCSAGTETDDAIDCGIEAASETLDVYIRDNLNGTDAVLANGAKDLAENLIKVAKSCNAKTLKKGDLLQCTKNTLHATIGKTLEAMTSTAAIYKLDTDLEKQNADILAMELFFTSRYYNVAVHDLNMHDLNNSDKTNDEKLCYLGTPYDFNISDCKAEDDIFTYVIDKAIDKTNNSNALTSNWSGTIKYDENELRARFDNLVNQFEKLYNSNYQNLKEKYADKLKENEKKWLYNQVTITQPTISIIENSNSAEDANTLKACFDINTKSGINNIEPSIQLIDGNNTLPFTISNDTQPSQPNSLQTYCGTLEYNADAGEKTLIIKDAITFNFPRKNSNFTVENFSLYNATIPETPKLTVAFRHEYSKKLKSYYFYSSIYDNNDQNTANYQYQWKVDADDVNCSYDLFDSKGYMAYGAVTGIVGNSKHIAEECLNKPFNILLRAPPKTPLTPVKPTLG